MKEKNLNLEPLSLNDLSQDAGRLYISVVYVITRPHGEASYAIKLCLIDPISLSAQTLARPRQQSNLLDP